MYSLTRTDAAGKFFINVPERQRGEAKALVDHRNMIAVDQSKIPSRKDMKLELKPTRLAGVLALSDKSPLSGLRIASDYFFPDDMPVDRAHRLVGPDVYTNARGRFYLQLPEKERVGITFYLPDGKSISKVYPSESLAKRSRTFVYDPVAGDILSDVNARRNDQQGQRQNRPDKPARPDRPDRPNNPGQTPRTPAGTPAK